MQLNSKRMVQVLAGSGVSALATMLLAVAILLERPLAEYGFYAFLQVLLGLAMATSSALFVAPLLSRLNPAPGQASAPVGAFFLLQTVLILVLGLVVYGLSLGYQHPPSTALGLALAMVLQLWRWFARSILQTRADCQSLISSDAIFSGITLFGLALLWWQQQIDLASISSLTIVAAIGSMLSAGRIFWQLHTQIWQQCCWAEWRQGYQAQGKPAFIGVLSSESAANAHSYLVTLIAGPAAFAPIAAAAMVFRPCALLLTNFSQLSRSQLLQLKHQDQALLPLVARFRQHAAVLWLLNVLLLLIVVSIAWEPIRVFLIEKQLDEQTIVWAILGWCVLTLLRCWRSGATIYLQVQDQFAVLARTAVMPALLSVGLVIVSLQWWPAVWTLAAIIVSELWMAWLLRRAVLRTEANSADAKSMNGNETSI